jgi:hypothetical protein
MREEVKGEGQVSFAMADSGVVSSLAFDVGRSYKEEMRKPALRKNLCGYGLVLVLILFVFFTFITQTNRLQSVKVDVFIG